MIKKTSKINKEIEEYIKLKDIFKSTIPIEYPNIDSPSLQNSIKQKYLTLIAKEYIERTENFDRKVCTGKIIDNAIMPKNENENLVINMNARRVFNELLEKVIYLNYTKEDFRIEILSLRRLMQSIERT